MGEKGGFQNQSWNSLLYLEYHNHLKDIYYLFNQQLSTEFKHYANP